ncbi:MAG TPA: leucyl aminopeptidase [Gammaproteobacteria bacterium]|nr:leucyl aminopeptidase [Gammaproteobacteria bacterium]
MEFAVKTGAPASQRTACAIIPVFEGRSAGAAKAFDRASEGLLRRLVRQGDARSKLGSTLLVPHPPGSAADRWLLVGCGKPEEFDTKRLAAALSAAVAAVRSLGLKDAISYLTYEPPADLDPYYSARISVEAIRTASYRFDELKSEEQKQATLGRVGIAAADASRASEWRRGIAHGTAIANGMDLARDLGNRPPNVCTPSHMAEAAAALAERHAKLEVKVLTERDLKRLGMGAFLSVTQGAAEPPRLIVAEYRGAAKSEAPVAICGKGITFDTGGISLKPPPKMDEMKFDMCGAAGVLGTLAALGELELPLNVVAVVPCCENMPGGRATRPGDIVKSLSGKTIEILNTDAEGRLVLADALTYARRYNPRFLLDVATLTGACVIALGHLYTGVFSNDDGLRDGILAAGKRSLDAAWPLPADDEFGESLASNFADFANAGSREGGASVAAQFLSRFVEKTPWAHLDIAGVAWKSNSSKGATGRPVPLLVDFLLNLGAANPAA